MPMITENEQVLLSIIDLICCKKSEEIKTLKHEDPEFGGSGSYPYIPIDGSCFFKNILTVRNAINSGRNTFDKHIHPTNLHKNKPSFIDYGAGIGMTMIIACHLGFKCTGIEIDKECLEKSMLRSDPFNWYNLLEGDLTNPSVFAGESYDVVYYYCPFSNKDMELKFELEAIKKVKIGGYIIAPYPGKLPEYHNIYKTNYKYCLGENKDKIKFYNQMKNFEKIQDFVYKRIK